MPKNMEKWPKMAENGPQPPKLDGPPKMAQKGPKMAKMGPLFPRRHIGFGRFWYRSILYLRGLRTPPKWVFFDPQNVLFLTLFHKIINKVKIKLDKIMKKS